MQEVSKEVFYDLIRRLNLDVLPDWMETSTTTTFCITRKNEIELPYLSSPNYSSNIRSVLAGGADVKIEAEQVLSSQAGVVRVRFKERNTIIWHQDDTRKYYVHTIVLYVGE